MASPDILQYVPLELVDQDPQDIYELMVSTLQIDLPDWEPNEGNVEVVLMEGIAVAVAQLIFSINRLPDGIFEVLLQFLGVTRDVGSAPTVDIEFEMTNTLGGTIPAGTLCLLPSPYGFDDLAFATNEDLIIPNGESNGTVSSTADRYTSEVNGTAVSTALAVVDAIPSVEYARTATVITGGRDQELDTEYFDRGAARFQRLSSALSLPLQFEAYAAEKTYVERVLAIDNYNPANDPELDGPVGNDAGYITVTVYGENEEVSDADKQALEDEMSKLSLVMLEVKVIDPQITDFDIDVDIVLESGVDQDTVLSDVVGTLRAYHDPMSWPWRGVIRRNDIISIISGVPGVSYVSDLAEPAANIELSGVANLVKVDQINVSVVSE